MTLRLQLLCAIVGTAALFVAGIRLARAIPPLYGLLVLLCLFISVFVTLGMIGGLSSQAFINRIGQAIDLNKFRYYEMAAENQQLKDELARADQEARISVQDKRDLEYTIAEQAKHINAMEPMIKELYGLRRKVGERESDKQGEDRAS